jgi:hypothetical protein
MKIYNCSKLREPSHNSHKGRMERFEYDITKPNITTIQNWKIYAEVGLIKEKESNIKVS